MFRGFVTCLVAVSFGACGSDIGDGHYPSPPTTCERWQQATAISAGDSSAQVSSCEPGSYSTVGKKGTLDRINALRFFAGLEPVVENSGYSQGAQACALIMDAENRLSHTPDETWDCYSDVGADGAGHSNISTQPSIPSVMAYMEDAGANNYAALGHRRWILDSRMTQVGMGSTADYSCLWVVPEGGAGQPSADYVAWPPGGEVPFSALGYGNIDDTGWSLQSSTFNIGNGIITVSSEGVALPVQTRVLSQGAGDFYAIGWIPSGWSTQPGMTYHVQAQIIVSPFPEDDVIIEYDVVVLDC